MPTEIIYREIRAGEENAVCRMVEDCFNEFIAPSYSQEGRDEFLKSLNPEFIRRSLERDCFIIVAVAGHAIVGMIRIRQNNHISLLFVKKDYQQRDIARKLLELALDKCRQSKPDVTVIDVGSSPYAVPVYERLGFVKTDNEQTFNGMRFTPMTLTLQSRRP